MKRAFSAGLSGLLLNLLVHAQTALAIAPVCIAHNDSASLTQALANAASSGLSTTIEVEEGTYTVPPTGWIYQFSPYQNISLLGGYIPGTNCQQRQITASPNTPSTNTILDGQSQDGAYIALGVRPQNPGKMPYGTLTIEGFEIRNLRSTAAGGSALFAAFNIQDGRTGGIVFRYNWVHDSVAAATAVELDTAGPMTVTNNLIDKNISAESVWLESADFNTAPWRIVNNTIANNTGEGLLVYQPTGTYVQLFNNILYANTGFDLDALESLVELHGDTYGTSVTSGSGNISNHGYAFAGVDPGYDTTSFHLTAGSGSINSGAGFASVLPTQDLDGNPRWVGSNPDRGAFETATSDQAYWVVTSSADTSHATDSSVNCNPGSTTCTLREAITRANAAGASTIAFHFGSTCGPNVILLTSPLPNVNVPLLIDGFSQPGAASNTRLVSQGGALNETLCVVIEGAVVDNVASALIAGSSNFGAQLEVRGVTFEGFLGPAIALAQGSYHWIHGNTFGVETDANPFVFSNASGVQLGSGVTFSTVGGNAPSDVNVFGNMNDASKAAITVNATPNGHIGSAVAGNLIGLTPANLEANQGSGLLLQNTTYNEIYDNTIVASVLDGIDISNASANWVHDNTIGSAPQFGILYSSGYGNGGAGIALYSNSAGNHIGVFDDTASQIGYSNIIMNNNGPGVWIESSAGVANTVLTNSIGANGPGPGGDLAIDTGALGSSAPSGAPTVSMLQSYLLGFGTMDLNFLVTGTGGTAYRVDFYNNPGPACDSSGYGPAESPVQTYSFTMPGSGYQVKNLSQMLPVVNVLQSPANVAAAITDLSTHTTAQISNCVMLPNDRIFSDGFEAVSAGGF